MNTQPLLPQATPEVQLIEIAYWTNPNFWTDDIQAANTCDEYQAFATQSQRTHVPANYNREQIDQYLRELLAPNPCAQAHTGVNTPVSTPTPCAQG